jgi:hypothetical protein
LLDVRFFASLYWPGFGFTNFLCLGGAHAFFVGSIAGLCRGAGPWVGVGCGLRQGWRDSIEEGLQGRQRRVSAAGLQEGLGVLRADDCSRPETPTANQAYFFLGNSYDNQYKPSKKGDAANDAMLTKAVDNYQKAAEKLAASPDPADKKLGKLSLEYLVASYGPDKLNDPAKAEPVVQRMIQLEPASRRTTSPWPRSTRTRAHMKKPRRCWSRPRTPSRRSGGLHDARRLLQPPGHFDKTIEALEERAAKEPSNPRRSTPSPPTTGTRPTATSS